jgi:hypothetical protein
MKLLVVALLGALLVAVTLAALPGVSLAQAAQEPGLHVRAAAEPIPRGLLGPRGINGLKAAVATTATLLLGLSLWLERRGRDQAWRRTRDGALAALGLAGALLWWNLGQFNFPDFAHPSDTFHYYLGAKYFPELGYTRLYACTAVADQQAGLAGSALDRPMRDLETNLLVRSSAALADPAACTAHFSAARWAAFRRDVAFLRGRVNERRWNRFQQDHGYNATPTWTVLGRALTSTAPASDAQLLGLRLIDPVLLLGLWAAVVWAFGWRIACVAAIYWGTNYPAPFGWTGGSILRQDWLFASIAGITLLRRERPFLAGLLLSYAVLLRIFPAFLVAGIGLGALGNAWRVRRPVVSPELRRLAAGGLLGVAVLLPLSALATGGFGSWADFVANSRVHLSTPLANHVGLRTVLSYDHEQRSERARDTSLADPMQPWKQARAARFESRRWLYAALVAIFALVVARAGAGAPAWVGAVLGVALLPVATELTGYYWSVLLAFAFAAERKPVMAVALCALAALGWAIGDHWHWTDEIHVWISVLTVSFCVFAVLLLTPREASTRLPP